MASSKTGIFHQIKQHVFHGQKHVDADYDAAFHKFEQLQTTLQKLKADANNYISSVYSVFLHSNNVSVDFSDLLDEAASSNPYQSLAQQFRQTHNKLNSEKQQQIVGELNEKCLKPLEEHLKTFSALQTRIAKRNELHGELEYYLNKVHELNKERDERSSKGKSEGSKNLEKMDRNQQKLNTSRNEYTNFTAPLIADLLNVWNQRIAMLGPMLAAFVQTEKTFLQIYATELSVIDQRAERLTSPPAEAIVQPIHPSEVPRPVVAGDVIAAKASSPPAAAPLEPQQSSSLEPNPFDTPVQVTSRLDPNVQSQTDSTYQTMSSQPTAPGGVQATTAQLFNTSMGETQASTVAVERSIVIDPTTVQQEMAGYTHTTALPGYAQPNTQNIAAPMQLKEGSDGLLKSQGEEESKRQRYEEDQKVRGEL